MADTIADSAELMVAPLIGNILVMVNEAGSIKDDVVVNVVFINMGTDHVFIFSFSTSSANCWPKRWAVSASTSPGLKDWIR